MSATRSLLAACLLMALVSSGAMAQEKPPAPPPAHPGQASGAAQDLEPAVNTSAPAEDAHAKHNSHAATLPAPSAKTAVAPARPAQSVPHGNAKDRIDLDTTQITGNRELPKVLYIVPWKHSDLSDLAGRPSNSLLDEVLMPVDRDVFKRENRYYGALQPDEPRPGGKAEGAGAADAPRTRDEK
jgi:hypothetical protein